MTVWRHRLAASAAGLALCLAFTLPAGAAEQAATGHDRNSPFRVRNLVSDVPGRADHVDRNLINGWGLAFGPGTPAWVADAETGVSTVYDGRGNQLPLVVSIPRGSPTGIVFNDTQAFEVRKGKMRAPSRFIFSSEAGVIAAWSPDIDRTHAIEEFHAKDDAIYKGLAVASSHVQARLYATDFHNAKIDVFDGGFRRVRLPGRFMDPKLPEHFAPFGIRNLGGRLYVTYAKQDADREDDVKGPGLGFTDVFDAEGHLLKRLVSRGALNAPWGLAQAPRHFGDFGGDLLIGNFGDGTINAYDPKSGAFKGSLRGKNGRKLVIDGLWGVSFGNGAPTQPKDTLFFAAGPDDESHGLFGRIDAVGPGG